MLNRVDLVGTGGANVWVDEEQRSFAIGKMGQNIALASQLTGLSINLAQNEKRGDVETEDISLEEIG